MYFEWDNFVLDALQASCVALPAAGLPKALERFRGGAWALILPACIAVCIGAIELLPQSADAFSWIALIGVPIGAALAFGWAMRHAKSPYALLAGVLLAVVWIWPSHKYGQFAGDLLILASCVTIGRLLAGAAPLILIELGLVAMAVIDSWFVFSNHLQHANNLLVTAVPAPGFPQLQAGSFGFASLGYGDFFAAGVLGGLIAIQKRPAFLLAVITLAVSVAWDQLFTWFDTLPATVPPALVLIGYRGVDLWRGRRRRPDADAPRSPVAPTA